MKKKYKIDYKRGFKFMVFEVLIMLLLLLGGTLNFLAVKYNNGRMPFQATYDYENKTHFSFQEFSEIRVPLLTDIIKFLNGYWSIGDFVMLFGVLLLFINAYLMIHSRWKFYKRIK